MKVRKLLTILLLFTTVAYANEGVQKKAELAERFYYKYFASDMHIIIEETYSGIDSFSKQNNNCLEVIKNDIQKAKEASFNSIAGIKYIWLKHLNKHSEQDLKDLLTIDSKGFINNSSGKVESKVEASKEVLKKLDALNSSIMSDAEILEEIQHLQTKIYSFTHLIEKTKKEHCN